MASLAHTDKVGYTNVVKKCVILRLNAVICLLEPQAIL